jgi:hypothetical protein
VRRQAYASLAAFQLDTLDEIGALRPLWSYAALLRLELQQQQRAEGAALLLGRLRKQRQAAVLAQAAAECEALVQAALAHEHATRRRTAAAGSTAGSGRERGASVAAHAVSSAGAAALPVSHRLQSVLPKQLLGGSTPTAGDLLQRLADLPAAAVLYLYAPPPPPPSSGKAPAAAARQAAADYQAVFLELLKQPAVAGGAAEDAGTAAEGLAAWAAFLRRWLAAARASAKQQPQQAGAEPAMQIWQVVQQQLEGGSHSGSPAAAANAAWAAAALCSCTQQPLQPLVAAVHAALLSAATGQHHQHPAAVQRAATAALGAIAEAVRATLGTPVLQAAIHLLQQRLTAATATASATAAVTGLALACGTLCGSASACASASAAGDASAAFSRLPAAAEQVVQACLGSLVGVLCGALAAVDSSSISQGAAAAGLQLSAIRVPQPADEVLPAAAAALATALPAAGTALPLPGLLQALRQVLMAQLSQQPATQLPPAVAAQCMLLQAVAASGFSTAALPAGDIRSSLSLLLTLASSGQPGGSADGRVAGAAAAGAGLLLAAVLQQGFTPADSPAAVLALLLAASEVAGRLPHAAAAKQGAVAGVAALLSASAVDPSSPQFKAAGECLVISNPAAGAETRCKSCSGRACATSFIQCTLAHPWDLPAWLPCSCGIGGAGAA